MVRPPTNLRNTPTEPIRADRGVLCMWGEAPHATVSDERVECRVIQVCDRAENIRRVAHVASLFADSGVIAIVSVISPYEVDRQFARSIHERGELEFLEVFVDTPLEECERRDPKGLYARARGGKITGFTGVDAPYERPRDPDVELRPCEHALEDLVEQLVMELRARGVLGQPR